MRHSLDFLYHRSQVILDHGGLDCLYTRGMSIGQWIKEARRVAGLTQTELGEKLGRTKGNISAWEKDAHEPSFTQILEIARLINWDPPPPGLGKPQKIQTNLTAEPAQEKALWPFPSIPEDQVRKLSPAQISALEGAIALAIAQMNLGIQVAPRPPVAATPIPSRSHKPGGLVDIGHADDPFFTPIEAPAAPWEGGKTTFQAERETKVRLSTA